MPVMRTMPITRSTARAPPASLFQRIKGFLQKHKLVSRGLSGLSHVLPQYANPLTGLSGVASSLGYGRRRRPRRSIRKRRAAPKRKPVVRRKRRVVRRRRVARRR